MTRMQQHVDRSKHNLNSLFEEVISSVEKDCTFKPSLEPTRAVNEALLQKRASSLGFEGSVEQVVLCFSSLCEWTCDFDAMTGSTAAGLQAVVHDAAGPALPCLPLHMLFLLPPLLTLRYSQRAPASWQNLNSRPRKRVLRRALRAAPPLITTRASVLPHPPLPALAPMCAPPPALL